MKIFEFPKIFYNIHCYKMPKIDSLNSATKFSKLELLSHPLLPFLMDLIQANSRQPQYLHLSFSLSIFTKKIT